MALATLTTIAPAIQNFYDGVLLDRALPKLLHNQFGQKRPVNQKSGNIAKFRRYTASAGSTAPLLDGITPGSLTITVTDLTETLEQYGGWIEYTDNVDYFNEDPVITELTQLCGEDAATILDKVWRDKLNAGSSVYYAGAVVGRTNVTTKLTATEFDIIRRTLADADAQPFEANIKPTGGIGTTPIRSAYICIVHPDVTYDLETILGTAFIPVSQYSNPSVAYDREVGAYKNFRFIETTNAKWWASAGAATAATFKSTDGVNKDVYSILILAQNAYGVTDLKGAALETIVKSKKEIGGPLEQKGTVGWKGITGLCILQDLYMMRYEVCVSS